MSWPSISTALKEHRRELCLTGKDFCEHFVKHGLDAQLFEIASLNFLTIHNTPLETVTKDIANLRDLQTLSLHSNKIKSVCSEVSKLDKLKIVDFSRNCLASLQVDLNALTNLTTINLSNNQLDTFPSVEKCAKLQVVDLSHNKLKEFGGLCHGSLIVLSDLLLGNNSIAEISADVQVLASLKNFDVSNNEISEVPCDLINCSKLKDLNLKGNPVKDRRLLKLIDQCRTKQVLDYLRQHAPKDRPSNKKKPSGGKQRTPRQSESIADVAAEDARLRLRFKHASVEDDALRVVVLEEVRQVRPNIVCCLVHGLRFTDDTFRKFIQLQNRLHETLCERRNAATIATHDAASLANSTLIYTAMKPHALKIRPLNGRKALSGAQLFEQLQAEAESLRKEKKRNVYSGIHKYLYLLEGKPTYACVIRERRDEGKERDVISFPPITNSEVSKVSLATESILLEVTSHANVPLTRKIADAVLQEVVLLMGEEFPLTVEQLRVVDLEGNMKSVYPSKTDLNFDQAASIVVVKG